MGKMDGPSPAMVDEPFSTIRKTTLGENPAAKEKGRRDFRRDALLCLFRRLLDRDEIHRRGLAAPIDLQLELDPVALVEGHHAGPLDRRDVDERVRLAVVAGDEAEALRRVEELDRAR